ncbi:hypothetical protein [Actinocrispum wychmicini]|uniref:Uncharacterized protein n=1 Tax=Actinocrispum wychmicini TaxID=1213861 RepID=A0A4R2JH07_9PSEU|nr:hypothetical protein [Actinocrispum wychmicini]TCO58334.1 hypothetical protein EV192_105399 [Actinocrispum wychmicini]
MSVPYDWTPHGLPCYHANQAPGFLRTQSQLEEMGLRPTGGACAYVDSQYGPAALYLITDSTLANPRSWPPTRPSA